MSKLEPRGLSPIVPAIINAFSYCFLGYIMLGQTTKGVLIGVAASIGFLLCFFPGVFIAVLGAIDAHRIATALEAGEEIDVNQYKQETLYKIMKLVHKEAIYIKESA